MAVRDLLRLQEPGELDIGFYVKTQEGTDSLFLGNETFMFSLTEFPDRIRATIGGEYQRILEILDNLKLPRYQSQNVGEQTLIRLKNQMELDITDNSVDLIPGSEDSFDKAIKRINYVLSGKKINSEFYLG